MRVRNLSCPYCKKRTTRDKLVNHIEYNHSDQLPEGFTPLRMAFHVANNKPIEYRRPCRVCKQPTEWDEKKGRYNFLCSNPKCKEQYVAKMKADMGEKYGAYRPTATPEGLEKMLAARKISGKYKWSDGTIIPYTGSYELETLKFMDKIMEIKSEDLMVPGPILQYEFEGQQHYYISDMYYRPYNLLIEVKDGGNSKNMNKEYAVTRAKQMAKEKHVIENTDYNYIRLTDKNCGQLLAVMADLKMHLIENDKERVIHVNENTPLGAIAPIAPFNPAKDIVIVNYKQNHAFNRDSDYAIAGNPKLDWLYTRDPDGKVTKKDKSILHGCSYTPYIVRDRRTAVTVALTLNENKVVGKNFVYETVFGHSLYSDDQILFEETAEAYEDYYARLEKIEEMVEKAVGKSIKFNSPHDLFRWMRENLHYSNFSKLKSWEEVLNSKSGSCHDFVMFEKHFFDKFSRTLGVRYKTLFCMEYNPGEETGGRTHSFLYYWDTEDKFGNPLPKECITYYRWFEVAWGNMQGIRTYKSIDEMKADIKTKMLSQSNYKDVFFCNFPNMEPGCNLNELVDKCTNNSAIKESADLPNEITKLYYVRSKDGVDNACVIHRDYKKPMRGRSSMLLIKEVNGVDYVFLSRDKNGDYHAPGGGWERGEDPKDAAIRELNEEALLMVDRVRYCGELIEYSDRRQDVASWVKQNVDEPDWWYGYYSRIYVGFYAGKFTGRVAARDKEDSFAKDGKFYSVDDVCYSLPTPYVEAIKLYLSGGGEK